MDTAYKTGAVPRLTLGLHDIVGADGKLMKGMPIECVMIRSSSDLASLNYPAGTMAYTAGFKRIWQLDTNGNWVEVG